MNPSSDKHPTFLAILSFLLDKNRFSIDKGVTLFKKRTNAYILECPLIVIHSRIRTVLLTQNSVLHILSSCSLQTTRAWLRCFALKFPAVYRFPVSSIHTFIFPNHLYSTGTPSTWTIAKEGLSKRQGTHQ